MEKKEINHNKEEICSFSKETIDTTKDEYSIIIDCKGNEVYSVKFYKSKYLKEIVAGNIKKLQEGLMSGAHQMAENLMDKIMPGMITKHYEVKDNDVRN